MRERSRSALSRAALVAVVSAARAGAVTWNKAAEMNVMASIRGNISLPVAHLVALLPLAADLDHIHQAVLEAVPEERGERFTGTERVVHPSLSRPLAFIRVGAPDPESIYRCLNDAPGHSGNDSVASQQTAHSLARDV